MALQVFLLLLSLVALYYGAEFALEAAEKLGRALGFSPLVIGLVIVGFGTSLPELFVSQLASWRGEYPLALGNIVGSNVANLYLILGIAGVLSPLTLYRRDVMGQLIIHLLMTCGLIYVLSRSELNYLSAAVLFLFFILFLAFTYIEMRKEQSEEGAKEEVLVVEKITWQEIVKLNLGFAFLYAGGELIVYSGSNLGAMLGVSTFIISAVFVAFGTSLPELITAVMSFVKKKDMDLITGNILGSNIFNGAFILGSVSLHQFDLTLSFEKELWAITGASVLLILLAVLKLSFGRAAGIAFLGGYGAMLYFWIMV